MTEPESKIRTVMGLNLGVPLLDDETQRVYLLNKNGIYQVPYGEWAEFWKEVKYESQSQMRDQNNGQYGA